MSNRSAGNDPAGNDPVSDDPVSDDPVSDDPVSDNNVRSIGLGPELLGYVVANSGGEDSIAAELAVVTRERFGDLAGMNIEQDQGRFLEFLVGLVGARTVVEVGTFTGMSALFLARGLPVDGRLVCLDVDEGFVATPLRW